MTSRYACGFASQGIRRGDHVAMLMPNCPEFLYVLWGLGKLGAVAVPLNTAAKGELLSYFLTQSDSTALCVSEPLLGAGRPWPRHRGSGRCWCTRSGPRTGPVPCHRAARPLTWPPSATRRLGPSRTATRCGPVTRT